MEGTLLVLATYRGIYRLLVGDEDTPMIDALRTRPTY